MFFSFLFIQRQFHGRIKTVLTNLTSSDCLNVIGMPLSAPKGRCDCFPVGYRRSFLQKLITREIPFKGLEEVLNYTLAKLICYPNVSGDEKRGMGF